MKFTIDIPDEFLEPFCLNFGYQTEVPDEKGELVPNPEKQADFALRQLDAVVESAVVSWLANAAQEKARTEAIEKAKSDILTAKGTK